MIRSIRFATHLAEHVHSPLVTVTRKRRKFPKVYDSTTRADLLKNWDRS